MGSITLRIDDNVKNKSLMIAQELGLSLNSVVNIFLREFNRREGFPFAVALNIASDQSLGVFSMSHEDIDCAIQDAVKNRDSVKEWEYVTRFDYATQKPYKLYKDGRKEYLDV